MLFPTTRPVYHAHPQEVSCLRKPKLFEPYGTVETVRIMTDRETGRARGFGFVEMPDTRAAQSAIDALNGTHVAGRALTVNEARPREPRREPRQPRW
jgi:RNA recognition motif-containing protein